MTGVLCLLKFNLSSVIYFIDGLLIIAQIFGFYYFATSESITKDKEKNIYLPIINSIKSASNYYDPEFTIRISRTGKIIFENKVIQTSNLLKIIKPLKNKVFYLRIDQDTPFHHINLIIESLKFNKVIFVHTVNQRL